MATITLNPDGNVSLGNRQGEEVTLQPAAADYATGGYAIVSGKAVVNGAAANTQNCNLYQINGVIPLGGQGGYFPVWNPTTQKLQVLRCQAAAGPALEVPAGTDLSAFAFQLLLYGI